MPLGAHGEPSMHAVGIAARHGIELLGPVAAGGGVTSRDETPALMCGKSGGRSAWAGAHAGRPNC